MAKKDKTATNGEAGAAAGTGTGTKTKTKEKVEVTVHPGLSKLLKQHDEKAGEAASYLVEICELLVKDNISNPVLIKTIMDVRGNTEASAKSQASRMRSLLKDQDSFEALKRGEVTVRAAVKGAQARRVPSKISVTKAFDVALTRFCGAAKATGQDKKTIMATVEAALSKSDIK